MLRLLALVLLLVGCGSEPVVYVEQQPPDGGAPEELNPDAPVVYGCGLTLRCPSAEPVYTGTHVCAVDYRDAAEKALAEKCGEGCECSASCSRYTGRCD